MAASSMAMANSKAHVLVLPYPGQGHINPMLQFAKRLASKGPTTTLVVTHFIINSNQAESGPVQIMSISDGFDEVGFTLDIGLDAYIARFEDIGSKTLLDLIEKESHSTRPFTCIVYDTYVPWVLDVAKRVGLPAVAFSTQSCVVSAVYYYVNQGLVEAPQIGSSVSVAGSVPLARSDFPSFALGEGSYQTLTQMALKQFRLEKSDWILLNSFDELEADVLPCLKGRWRARAIGPTVPLTHVDQHTLSEQEHYTYGINMLQAADNDKCKQWLDSKPPASVVYISFGSFACLSQQQKDELANGLIASGKQFLWVVRASEQEKLPRDFVEHIGENGLIVSWSLQLAVLAHESVGCFVSHCGWNSTLEALSLGVPMVAMPQWTDQRTNAKYVEDVWRVGARARAEGGSGVVVREEIERCIREVMDGERSSEIRENAKKWRDLVREAVSEGGSSDKSLNEFVECVNAWAGGEGESPDEMLNAEAGGESGSCDEELEVSIEDPNAELSGERLNENREALNVEGTVGSHESLNENIEALNVEESVDSDHSVNGNIEALNAETTVGSDKSLNENREALDAMAAMSSDESLNEIREVLNAEDAVSLDGSFDENRKAVNAETAATSDGSLNENKEALNKEAVVNSDESLNGNAEEVICSDENLHDNMEALNAEDAVYSEKSLNENREAVNVEEAVISEEISLNEKSQDLNAKADESLNDNKEALNAAEEAVIFDGRLNENSEALNAEAGERLDEKSEALNAEEAVISDESLNENSDALNAEADESLNEKRRL